MGPPPPSGWDKSQGGGGLAKHNHGFVTSARADATAATLDGRSAHCGICKGRREGGDGGGKNAKKKHVTDDPLCQMKRKPPKARGGSTPAAGGAGAAGGGAVDICQVPVTFQDTRRQATLGREATSGGAVALLPLPPRPSTTEQLDSQDTDHTTTDSVASSLATSAMPNRATYDGALTAAAGGARTAVPPFILQRLRNVKDMLKRGDSRDALPPELYQGLYFEVGPHTHITAHLTTHA